MRELTEDDIANHTKKAVTPKMKKTWLALANSIGRGGRGPVYGIRVANSVVSRMYENMKSNGVAVNGTKNK